LAMVPPAATSSWHNSEVAGMPNCLDSGFNAAHYPAQPCR
jgi:hypothetical protein